MSDTLTWLITGTSRGIGLEIVRQLIASPTNIVIATCRNPDKATALQGLASDAIGKLHILPLDTSSSTSIEGIAKPVQEIVGEAGLDYLINDAAINYGEDRPSDFAPANLLETLNVNVVGPAHLAQVLLPLIEKSKRKFILNFSSGLASIGLDYGGKNFTYSISKTAVNMLTYKLAKFYPALIVIAIDPGWVKTEMGGAGAMLEASESVAGILGVASRSTSAESGKFLTYEGQELPW